VAELGSGVRVKRKILNMLRAMMVAGGLIAFAALSACAAPTSYMGIDLGAGGGSAGDAFQSRATSAGVGQAEIGSLARRAQAGDKQAQLELGIRFEEGRGVARDLNKARKLYAKAATGSGGTIWVYSPPVGNGTKGRVIPVNSGPKQVGLAEAKRRLEGVE